MSLVPKNEESHTYISCMDTAYVRESPPPKTAKHKVQYLQIRYLNPLMKVWLAVPRWHHLGVKHTDSASSDVNSLMMSNVSTFISDKKMCIIFLEPMICNTAGK